MTLLQIVTRQDEIKTAIEPLFWGIKTDADAETFRKLLNEYTDLEIKRLSLTKKKTLWKK